MLTVTEKKLTDSRKRAQILADNRKSHHPIETCSCAVSGFGQVYTVSVKRIERGVKGRHAAPNEGGLHLLEGELI